MHQDTVQPGIVAKGAEQNWNKGDIAAICVDSPAKPAWRRRRAYKGQLETLIVGGARTGSVWREVGQ
jgi:hypothetical protein